MSEQSKCELCGEPMPVGEEMFKYHGHSGPCPAKVKTLELWQTRVVDEKAELDKRLGALRDYINRESFLVLQLVDQDALIRQEMHMSTYSDILGERIARFTQK